VKSDVSTHLTLRFKYGNLTVLLFADELTAFSKIKEELLTILRDTQPNGLPPPPTSKSIERVSIPDFPEHVFLATPKNKNDLAEGWKEIDTTSADGAKECPKALGLKDADALAFVVAESTAEKPDFWVELPDVNALYPEDTEEMEVETQ
jgi:hypothetical protein